MDKIKHFFLCFLVTLVCGWQIGVAVALTIELTQAEYGNASLKVMWWRMTSRDTLGDLLADSGGIVLGLVLRLISLI
jgi:hypothetical protein